MKDGLIIGAVPLYDHAVAVLSLLGCILSPFRNISPLWCTHTRARAHAHTQNGGMEVTFIWLKRQTALKSDPKCCSAPASHEEQERFCHFRTAQPQLFIKYQFDT